MTKTAIIYARFSSAEQALGYSLERQVLHGEQYVSQQGWLLREVITDEARSAFHGKNRIVGSSLHEFEQDSLAGKNRDVVLCVENVDRLSRQGLKECVQLIWKLNDAGVDVATWHDGKLYSANARTDMLDLFTIAMTGERAYDESLTKSKRGHDSWKKRYCQISAGEKIAAARPPAWIDKKPDGYALNEHRKDVLNEIFDLYIAGHGIPYIVQTLNSRPEPGWAIRKDKVTGEVQPDKGWYQAYVYRLLTHRAVLGEYVTLKGETLSASYFPQAISADKFNRAQEVRGTRKVVRNGDGKRANNLLTGIVQCSECMGNAGYERRNVNRVAHYVTKAGEPREYKVREQERMCCDNNRRGRGCTNAVRYSYQVIEGAVLARLAGFIVDEDRTDPAVVKVQAQVGELQRVIEVAEGQIANLVDAIADGGSKALVSRIAALESEVESHRAALGAAEHELSIWESRPLPQHDIDLVNALRDELSSEDDDVRYAARHQTNMALKRIIQNILLSPDGTFAVVSDFAVWHFDAEGKIIGGQAI